MEILITHEDDFKEMKYRRFQWCHDVILVYSVINKSSFDYLDEIYREIIDPRNHRPIKCIIAGNKADLKQDDSVPIEESNKLQYFRNISPNEL